MFKKLTNLFKKKQQKEKQEDLFIVLVIRRDTGEEVIYDPACDNAVIESIKKMLKSENSLENNSPFVIFVINRKTGAHGIYNNCTTVAIDSIRDALDRFMGISSDTELLSVGADFLTFPIKTNKE